MAPTPQDCGESDSLLEVATAAGGSSTCPDGKLKDSQYSVLFDKTTTLCFLLNLQQGQCYAVTGTPESPTFATSSCDGSVPVVQVVRRVDGNSDRTLCPTETKAVSYPAPRATVLPAAAQKLTHLPSLIARFLNGRVAGPSPD
jgi:hypothetical protein